MKGVYLKRFAILLSLLLLLQESHQLVKTKCIGHIAKRSYANDFLCSNDHQLLQKDETVFERPKRFIFTLILIVTTVVSISLTVYKEVRGCKDITPDLEPTVDKGKAMEPELNALQATVQSTWEPVQIKQQYTDEMAKDMNIIREKIITYNTLMADIVNLLDRRLLDNVNTLTKKLENDIDNNNEESLAGFPDLLKKFGSAFTFALTLSVQFTVLGGASISLISKSVSTVATTSATKWASANTGRVTKLINQFAQAKGTAAKWAATKITALKSTLNTKWVATIGTKLAKFTTFFSKLGQTSIGKVVGKAVSLAGKAIVKVGASIAAVILFAFDIWNFVEFVNGCHDKMADATKALKQMEENKVELNGILTKINELKVQVDEYNTEMMNIVTSDTFKDFLGQVIKLGEGAQHQTDDIKVATTTIQNYINKIGLVDLAATDALNKDLMNAFEKINYKLLCLKSKIAIRMSVVDNCEDGKGTFTTLYNEAKTFEPSLNEECIQGEYMSEAEVRGLVDLAMEQRGAQKICIRNNGDKLKLACANVAQHYNDERNAELVKVTVDDIKYFITKCDISEISQQFKLAICSMKTEEKSIDQVLAKYSSIYHAQIRVVYDQCKLTESELYSICAYKDNGYDLSFVQAKFTLYTTAVVESAFNGCQQKTSVTPGDGTTICSLKKAGISPDDETYANIWAGFLLKYTKSIITAYYNGCSS